MQVKFVGSNMFLAHGSGAVTFLGFCQFFHGFLAALA
jgi:hypothetical protein